MNESVSLQLEGDEALVFFEFAHRFIEKDGARFPAERAVFDILIAQIEPILSAPFAREYHALVEAARARVAEKWGRA
jgi:hypothetical protein